MRLGWAVAWLRLGETSRVRRSVMPLRSATSGYLFPGFRFGPHSNKGHRRRRAQGTRAARLVQYGTKEPVDRGLTKSHLQDLCCLRLTSRQCSPKVCRLRMAHLLDPPKPVRRSTRLLMGLIHDSLLRTPVVMTLLQTKSAVAGRCRTGPPASVAEHGFLQTQEICGNTIRCAIQIMSSRYDAAKCCLFARNKMANMETNTLIQDGIV